jgi:hypothetical protein
MTDALLPLTIRKIATVTEETLLEAGRQPFQRTRLAAAMAVIVNPYAGRYVEDLSPMVDEYCPPLGTRLAELVVDLLEGHVESYGKGALVGEDGELEHGSALIHSLKFGNPYRDAAKGTALLPSAEKRGGCGSPIDVAMKHKENHALRSHHWTFEVRLPDAPRADEILVICAGATSGRPLARIGRGPEDDDV